MVENKTAGKTAPAPGAVPVATGMHDIPADASALPGLARALVESAGLSGADAESAAWGLMAWWLLDDGDEIDALMGVE